MSSALELFKGQVISVHIANNEQPQFFGYRLANIYDDYIALENPENFSFVYINKNKITHFEVVNTLKD